MNNNPLTVNNKSIKSAFIKALYIADILDNSQSDDLIILVYNAIDSIGG